MKTNDLPARTIRDNVHRLFDAREPELPVRAARVSHLLPAAESVGVDSAGIDLTGKPKLVLLIGPGGSGKTHIARLVCEKALQREDRQPPVIVALDPVNRDLAEYFPDGGTIMPTGIDATQVADWFGRIVTMLMEKKRSAVVDFGGGGETALIELVSQVPDLAGMLEEAGVSPVALYTLTPRHTDITSLAAVTLAGFRPTATALVLNCGRMKGKDPVGEFAYVRRQPEYIAAVERGAVQVWMPKLQSATAIEMRGGLGFFDATNNGGGTAGMALNVMDRRRTSDWLGKMDVHMAPIASWLEF